MTSFPGDEFRDWDAAYVLGMLSPDDRRAYERHLATCETCTAALAQLAGLPGILSALTSEEVSELTTVTDAAGLHDSAHQPGLVQRLAATSARRRRRTRLTRVAASVLVAAVVAVGAFAVGAFFIGSSAGTGSAVVEPAAVTAIAMTPVVKNTVSANLAVTPKTWGTRLDWNCAYASHYAADAGLDYDLVVTDTSGAESVVASWTAHGNAATNLSASTRVATDDIRSVDIRLSGSDTALATATL